LGSILSNLLLVLGLSFFCGGLFHFVQIFNAQGIKYIIESICKAGYFCYVGAMHNISLLLLACLGFITPTIGLSENMSSTKILTVIFLIYLQAIKPTFYRTDIKINSNYHSNNILLIFIFSIKNTSFFI
jgi:Ca2+/H+ antiporter